ncbi:AAA family ATPase [Bradyrhizobium septentrionale]|uniref:ATP-binding protein n=1 Tax=Bradyrhizobium septentrionale TaxID=1404411 RepID=A0A973ZYA2_9BRAD|nr:ATP-binding protein [Bradyrhizobium septentrionale]UGY19163.1 ATP-binding protein [Bradyrhizobium septentrionale]UGY27895.1 ATP-binding protein [Bradyrhizobium septentrionale]
MNTKLRGFSFATRSSDDESPAIQALGSEPAGPALKGKGLRRPHTAQPRLPALARSQLTASGLLELIEPQRGPSDLIVSTDNYQALAEIVTEVRRGEELRRHGLSPRSKLLFCGPPGCGKTLCAEVLARELKLPLLVARLDEVITTYLGATASNLRKAFDAAVQLPTVLFLDEFDALARARTDTAEHNEIRRVVNSLLMLIDRFAGKGLLIAATNLEGSIDRAAWRRFDEVMFFDQPTLSQVKATLKLKTRNFPVQFDVSSYAERFEGMSFAEIERVCLSAIRASVLARSSAVTAKVFEGAIRSERRRISIKEKIRQNT